MSGEAPICAAAADAPFGQYGQIIPLERPQPHVGYFEMRAVRLTDPKHFQNLDVKPLEK